MGNRISQMTVAGTLTGTELVEVSQLSASVTITASTISAQASDNSYNDSGNGFVSAGFTSGKAVKVSGFTGNGANNVVSAVVTAVTAGKLTIGGTDGDVIVDDAAGESVTITQWNSRRVDADTLVALAGGGSAGRHSIPIMASAMTPRVTNGCASLAYHEAGTDKPDVPYLAFDASSAEYAEFSILMPKSWNEGTVTFAPVWMHPATTTNFGVVWDVQGVAVDNADQFSGATFGTDQTSTDTGGTTHAAYFGPESSAITIANSPTAECLVCFRVGRKPADGGDTLAVDAWLLGIALYLTTDASTDA